MSIKDDVMSWSSTFFQKTAPDFLPGSFLQRCSLLFVDIFSVHHIHQILAVLIFLQWLDVGQKLVFADPAVQVTDLLEARDLAVLMGLDGFYEVGCLYKAFVCTGIQPCEALAQKLNVQLSLLKVDTVQVSDLKLASCAWL